MRYSKKPISISDQVTWLKDKGLSFSDEKFAEQTLSRISYYRLRAYTYPFQDNRNPKHPFVVQISFEEIIDLCKFDRELRVLLFDAIEKIYLFVEKKIVLASEANENSTIYIVPSFFVGLPTYNLANCRRYIQDKLIKNGFKTTFYLPNLLHIIWK